MLYFTSQTVRLNAVYSGRFAFIANASPRWIEWALSRLNDETPPAPESSWDIAEAFVEEHRHAQLFLSCRTGRVLGGLLVLVRVCWLLFGSRRVVYDYYRLRTAFFAVMYELHEAAVKKAQEEKSESIPAPSVDRVQQADRVVWEEWRSIMPGRASVLLILAPFLSLAGGLFARHFTVISQEYHDGFLVERNHAHGGFVNDLYADRSPLPSMVQRFLQAIRPESIVPNTFAKDWDWMLLKFLAERDTWVLVKKHHAHAEAFGTYAAKILAFVGEWVHLHQARPIATVCRSITASTPRSLREPPQGWDENDQLKKLVNFFYLHGN